MRYSIAIFALAMVGCGRPAVMEPTYPQYEPPPPVPAQQEQSDSPCWDSVKEGAAKLGYYWDATKGWVHEATAPN